MRVTISKNGPAAVAYYSEALSKEDYFFNERVVDAIWQGKTAQILGIAGQLVSKEVFTDLVQNVNPITKSRLTMRHNSSRRAGYEYCFNSPKSASILYALTGDQTIIKAHREGVRQAMAAIQRDMCTQVSQEGRKFYQRTGNLIYASFEHLVTRPVEYKKGQSLEYIPDCHLHSHAFVPNVTWNAEKNRFQALEEGNIRRQAPFYEAIYHAVYSRVLAQAGYKIIRSASGWEVKGADSKPLRDKFSNRTIEIEKLARAKGILDQKAKSALGARSRIKKSKGINKEKLSTIWKERPNSQEWHGIRNAKGDAGTDAKGISVKQAIDLSLEHWLERLSAPQEKRVLAYAMQLGYGHLSPEAVQRELDSRDNLLRSDQRGIVHITTKEMVWAEDKMIAFAANGRDTVMALNPDYAIQQDFLNDQQRNAIIHLLKSRDRVSILKGSAGVGKTSLLTEVREAIQQRNIPFMAVAPSAKASRGVLREKGFDNADTITALLTNPKLQAQIKNGVLLVDEAPMAGVNTLNELFRLAENQGARIILSGDIRQHTSIQAGDAVRLIEEKAGIKPAVVQRIVRQKPQNYNRAISHLAKGNTLKGFGQLDKMGAVLEIEDRQGRYEKIARDYTHSLQQKRTALIIAPTHQEGRMLSEVVRDKLKNAGEIKGRERVFDTMLNLSLTQAQKQDPASYQAGYIVRFHQNQKGGFKAGGKYKVLEHDKESKIRVRPLDNPQSPILSLPISTSPHFEVYKPDTTPLAIGDRLSLSANGKSLEQTKLHNQSVYRVEGFTRNGDIRLSNGKTLSKDFRSFRHAYVSTSFAAQGRDAKDIYIGQSSESFSASNQQQFYVSTSRGSERVFIYTDNKQELKTAIARSAERMSAQDVARDHYNKQLQKGQIRYHQKQNPIHHGHQQPVSKRQSSFSEISKPSRSPERG